MAGSFHAQNCEYEWEYTSEIFEFPGVPIIVSNMYLNKTFISWYIPPILNSYYLMKGYKLGYKGYIYSIFFY